MKDFLECGKVVSTHGVHGEVKAEVWMDHPEEMTALKRVYLDGGKTPLTVKSARVHKNAVLLTLEGITTPEAGSTLRQKVLFARREDIPLKKGQYFLQDLIGLAVVDADSGQPLGTVAEVDHPGAQDIYTVRDAAGQDHLIPAVPEFVVGVDLAARTVTMRPIGGMFDEPVNGDEA